MLKKYLKIVIKVSIVLGIYYFFAMFFDDIYIFIGVGVLTVVVIMLFSVMKSNEPEYELEDLCNPSKYLLKIKKLYENKEKSIYNAYLAYAYTYQGNFEKADLAINEIDKDSIKEDGKALLIYYIVLLKLAFEEEDLEEFNTVYNEFKEIKIDIKENVDHQVFEIPKYILEERYEEIVELLIELIPQQKKKYIVLELEYYLAIAYMKLGNFNDARAVLEFVSSKKYQVFYVERCRELLKTIPEEN